MIEDTAKLISDLEEEINRIKGYEENICIVYKEALVNIASACEKFTLSLESHTFESKEEEIYIFKELKPFLFSHLFYYNDLLKIESKNIHSSVEHQIKFYEKYINKLNKYFKSVEHLYCYYQKKDTSFDRVYFAKNNH